MRGDEKMPDQVLEILKNINQNLEDIKKEEKLPKLIYAKEIAEKYRVNLNTAVLQKIWNKFWRILYRK